MFRNLLVLKNRFSEDLEDRQRFRRVVRIEFQSPVKLFSARIEAAEVDPSLSERLVGSDGMNPPNRKWILVTIGTNIDEDPDLHKVLAEAKL